MNQFLKKIIFETIIILAVGIFPFLLWWKQFWLELLCAFSISLLNAIFGYYLVLISIEKPQAEFYKNVYGGMLIRMIFVFGFSIFMMQNSFVLKIPYMLFLILFYVVHQWTEITSWLKELPIKKAQLN